LWTRDRELWTRGDKVKKTTRRLRIEMWGQVRKVGQEDAKEIGKAGDRKRANGKMTETSAGNIEKESICQCTG